MNFPLTYMSISAYIIGESPIPLWGLSSHTRLTRVLNRAGITDIVENLDTLPSTTKNVLLVRATYLYDERVLKSLIKEHNILLRVPSQGQQIAVAAIVSSTLAQQVCNVLSGDHPFENALNIQTIELDSLTSGYQEELKKYDPPFVLPIHGSNQKPLEDHLFAGSYKGVTDLVTKWAWPCPAKVATRWCARLGIRPNHLTSLSVLLTITAGLLFMDGSFWWGLLLGWFMTFLDTVDGKLARVTLTSSRIGHVLDKGLDIIHPPLWYIAWGMGLSSLDPSLTNLSLNSILWIIVGGYIVGRICEGIFEVSLGKFGIFCWRPIDSYHRLVTARRNPNLLLLTGSLLFSRPDIGLLAVAMWTVISSTFLIIRLAMAMGSRINSGPLKPWFFDLEKLSTTEPLAVRIFTRKPIHSE